MYGSGVDSETSCLRSTNNNKRRRKRKTCICASALTILTLLIIVVVILATVVFKRKNPETSITNISLDDLDMSVDILRRKVNLNVSLDVHASIKNPNKLGLRFSNASLAVNYKGQPVGDVPVPASKISGGGTLPLNLTLTVMADRLVSNSDIYRDVISGSVPLSTFIEVSGKVSILFVKVHVRSSSSCDITVFVSNRTIGNQRCSYNTKL